MKKRSFYLVLAGEIANPNCEGVDGSSNNTDSELSINLQRIVDIAMGNGFIKANSSSELDDHKVLICLPEEDKTAGEFNHAFDIAFEVISADKEAEDVTPLMLRAALLKRIVSMKDSEILEACGGPFDTYQIEPTK